MRKNGIATAAAALVLLCGCTQQEIGPMFEMSDFPMTLNSDCSALVDISTSEQGKTRGNRYETIEDLRADAIGIYCLPARKINKNAENIVFNRFIQYDENGDLINTNGVYWDNLKFTLGEAYGTGGKYRLIKTLDSHDPLFDFYPLPSNYGYDFYGYAPYQEGTADNPVNIYYRDQYLAVDFAIDGTQDIVHGQSVTPDDAAEYPSYYSAKYFRDTKKASAVDMKFSHKLVKFNFNVIPRPATIKDVNGNLPEEDDYTGVDSLAVKSIRFVNTKDSVQMIIAAEESYMNRLHNPEYAKYNPDFGPGYIQGLNKVTTATFHLHKRNSEGVWEVPDTLVHISHERAMKEDPINQRIKVGEYMMVYPTNLYTMEVELCSKYNPEIVFPKSILRVERFDENGNRLKFKGGSQYNINIHVEGSTAINVISAELVDWEDGDENGDDVEINYFD